MSDERAIARLAGLQHGVVTHAQLLDAGIGRGAIARRLAQHRLHRVHRGVYLVGHNVPPPFAHEAAAVLACGPGAVISHGSAAHVWGLLRRTGNEVDVTVPVDRNPRSRAGVSVHRTSRLDRHDVRKRHGLPITAPARTLLDLAEVLNEGQFERALAEAERTRLASDRDLLDVIARYPGKRGAAVLRAFMRLHRTPNLTRSEAERRMLALVRAARLPSPETNVRLGAYEVDLLWREARLVVEVDGYAFHSSRFAFERDRRRDADLQSAGFRVMRITWSQITHEPEALIARLAQTLAQPHQRLSSRQWR